MGTLQPLDCRTRAAEASLKRHRIRCTRRWTGWSSRRPRSPEQHLRTGCSSGAGLSAQKTLDWLLRSRRNMQVRPPGCSAMGRVALRTPRGQTERMHYRLFLVAFFTPVALLAIAALFRPGGLMLWQDPALLLSSWLHMAAPSILAMLIALAVRKARKTFLPAALVTLTGLLVTYQLGVWLVVPIIDSALAWVLYHPGAAVVMLAVGMCTAAGLQRRP